MGYKLRRQLREALGPDITGLQRAVALEIADDAHEQTRRSAVPLEKLVAWTGAKDASVVRNALKRLAASGWEFRVPIGKGKDGRTLYAVPGQRMTFLVPHFEGVAIATSYEDKGEQELPHGGATATPRTPEGGAGAHSEGATAHSEGATATPSHFSPSFRMQEGAPDETRAHGIPDAARPLVDSMSASGVIVRWPFKGDQWFPVLALINKCGVPALVEYARRTADRNGGVDSARYFMRGWAELPPKPADGTPVHIPRPQLRAVGQSPEDRGIF
ncbi:hypothetical protein [Streptomyces achromogenes]|uniref:hypothetical protein n=1 Tax=Streptomyces achromogenes TaxID=67255 RepID=UPI003435D31F